LLIVVGIAAGFFLWDTHQQSIADYEHAAALSARLDAVAADLAALSTAQQAYVAPGQSDGPWMERVSSLLQRLYDATASLAAHTQPGAAASLKAMRDGVEAVVSIDARVREYLRMDQELMASDLVFNEARAAVTSFGTAVSTLRANDAAQLLDAE